MELEELKLKWKVLSERLDREQVIRRQDMERMLRGRVGSYLHYVQLMLLLGVAVVPLCVAIGKFRGVSGIFIWWVVAGYLLCLLPSFFSLWLLLRVSRCDADIVECEHRMTRYVSQSANSAEYPVFSSGGSWRATFYVCSLRSFPCGCCCGCRAAMPISSSVNTA